MGGVLEIVESDAPYALVRTLAADAVERERGLRALHQALGERPMVQLHRAPPPLGRKPTKEDWALAAALRRAPEAPLEALAKEARQSPKLAKERLARLAAERVVTLEVVPREARLALVLVRASPSSTAAARRALDEVEGVVRAWLPLEGEASYADALAVGSPALERAREVPGIARVELLPIRARWRDASLIDAALRRAG